MSQRVRDRLAQDSGFTLVELLVAISVGMVVIVGILNLVDASGRANARLVDKSETVQRVRIGMDRIVRVLRTQVCPNVSTPPISEGTANSVTFYSDTNTNPTFAPRQIKLSYDAGFRDASNKVVGAIKQEVVGSGTTRVLVDNVEPSDASLFSYYSFSDLGSPVSPMPLDTGLSANPLPANSIAKIVKIDVGIRGRPLSGNGDTKRRTEAESSVYTRNSDFSVGAQAGRTWGPRCG